VLDDVVERAVVEAANSDVGLSEVCAAAGSTVWAPDAASELSAEPELGVVHADRTPIATTSSGIHPRRAHLLRPVVRLDPPVDPLDPVRSVDTAAPPEIPLNPSIATPGCYPVCP
jgi:hypothetical protein